MKIAIVDDERPARSELSFLITDILPEAEILEAASGAAALELFLSTPDIGLAFLDINLNDMEGTTLAAAMQKILPQSVPPASLSVSTRWPCFVRPSVSPFSASAACSV